ncbi:hypothetical protein D3C87_1419030 [compost metagenome]
MAASTASRATAASRMTRIPLPPPPATALTTQGSCMSPMASITAWRSSVASASPPAVGMPSRCAASLAIALSPNSSSVSGIGPMKVIPSSAQPRASSGFSDRNPKPG